MYERILVALDGSTHSASAARAAATLAAKFESELHLLTVVRPVKATGQLRSYLESERVMGESHYVLDAMTDAIMDEARETAASEGVKRVKTATREGKTARTICDYAKGNRIDLIVLGSRGRGEMEALLLGSVSTKVSMLAPCKVMLVK